MKHILVKRSGRNSSGKVTVRHQGGAHKRMYRVIDFKRDKKDIWAKVAQIEYDPNRTADLALVVYSDGEKRYNLAPVGLKVGDKIIASEAAPVSAGNCLPLSAIPVGTPIHNLEIRPGKGAQMVRSAGAAATLQGRENDYVLVKLPSGEIRRFLPNAWAVIGQVGNEDWDKVVIGKAGRSRHMGRRPVVRGVAMHPGAHPHGGGEGRSSVGLKYPKTYAGRPAVGRTRKKDKYSKDLIVSRRKAGKHTKNNS
jgi:large subunit ribosomal protein L2